MVLKKSQQNTIVYNRNQKWNSKNTNIENKTTKIIRCKKKMKRKNNIQQTTRDFYEI